jgi:hypothetical protein
VTPYLRRFIAIAAVGAALFTVSACADVPQEEPGTSTSPSVTKAALADKKTSCDAYKALDAEMTTKSEPLAKDLSESESDPAKALTAFIEIKNLISQYETKLTPIAANAGDAEVKAALEAELAKTRRVKADLDEAGTDPAKLQTVFENVDDKEGDKIKALCA